MLYPSAYNVMIADGNEVLLFNTRSLFFGRLDTSLYDDVVRLVEALNANPKKSQEEDEIKQIAFELRNAGFFVDDPAYERDAIKARFDKQKNSHDHLGLTIAPTNDCNFACPYCYENQSHLNMSKETQERVAAFIVQSLSASKYRSMHVTWYGGEPLMTKSLQAIEYLSECIIDACNGHNISYTANIISNGYLLNRTIAKRLITLQIGLIQITLDGPRELHNQTRILKNGTGTFDRLLENIKSCKDLLRFSIRMNVTSKNAQTVSELKRILREEGILDDAGKTAFYISPVRSYTTTCQSRDCLKNASFYKVQFDLLKQGINSDGFEVIEEFPIAKTSVCTAISADSFVIGPDGKLYKCWLDLGRDELAVGHVGNNSLELNEKINKWINFSPFDDPNCGSCAMMPICMGGCPELNIRSRSEEENQACCNWKYQLQDYLLYLAGKNKGESNIDRGLLG